MKQRRSRAERREAINQQVENYIAHGGNVTHVDQGVSGREHPEQALSPPVFDKPAESRTDVKEVLAHLDARKKKAKPANPKPRRPKKKLIYDDFGEPLRWVWEE